MSLHPWPARIFHVRPDGVRPTRSAGFQACCIASRPAGQTRQRFERAISLPTWKSATQQAWKPALRHPRDAGYELPGLAVALLVFLMGCGGKPDAGGNGHGHAEEAPSGASFKAGKGVILADETRQSLGVETAEVGERQLPLEIRFIAQVFGEAHAPTASDTNHAACTGKASGLVALTQAGLLRAGQPVRLAPKSGEALGGMVLGVNKALALGDAEVLLGITNAGARLKPGEFLSASITLTRDGLVAVVPRSALLRTAEGAFVYTLNGEAYFRTAVKTGTEAEGLVEITDGLLTGDVVVLHPVEKLWLIELRATKGGGHSH